MNRSVCVCVPMLKVYVIICAFIPMLRAYVYIIWECIHLQTYIPEYITRTILQTMPWSHGVLLAYCKEGEASGFLILSEYSRGITPSFHEDD